MGVIYMTTNLINGKKYIGKDTKNNPNYLGSGVYLKKSIQKYGKHNFEKTIIEVCSSHEELTEREEYWLNYYDAGNNPKFYNAHNYSYGGSITMSDETKRNISGENHYFYGKKHSEETKRKISESQRMRQNFLRAEKHRMYGKHHSNESKIKISESRKGEKHPNYGKTLPYETRKKMSESTRGEKHPNYGKTLPYETRKKMSESSLGEKNPMFGKNHSNETKIKMSKTKKMKGSHIGEKNLNFKGYIICTDGEYIGERKTRSEWYSLLKVDQSDFSKHLSGKSYKNGIKGNFFKWEHEIQS
jgi:group I intron endonuclease